MITYLCSSIGAIATRDQLEEYALPIAINDLNCSGSEKRLMDCPHNGLDFSGCYHGNDASVVCQPLYSKMWVYHCEVL